MAIISEPDAGSTGSPVSTGMMKGVVGLLALAVFINYVDRGNLATAATLIKSELKIDNLHFGYLISAFFWTYTPGQILVGWLIDKINAYRTLALGLALWSVATAFHGVATGFFMLMVLRVLLGIGESAAFPCSSKLFAEHLPTNKLGGANGAIAVGLALGPAIGTLIGGLAMAQVGWRPVFLIFGIVSSLWLIPWWLVTRHASARVNVQAKLPVPSFCAILKRRDAIGACLGHFSSNYGLYFILTWLPVYLVQARGFSFSQMVGLSSVIYVVYAASAQISGWACDRWMQAGASDTKARKTFAVTAHIGSAACLLYCAVGSLSGAIAALLLGAVFLGFSTTMIYTIGQTLAGPRAAGKWIALQNCIGNFAGIIGPPLTGFLVDRAGGQFGFAFGIAAAISLTGAICWGVIVRRVAPQDWNA